MAGATFWPNVPCHNAHPYGVMSDLHVQAVLIGMQHDASLLSPRRLGRPLSSRGASREEVLVLLVGLWRAPQCGRASQLEHLMRVNPHIDFSFAVCTDPSEQCSDKEKQAKHRSHQGCDARIDATTIRRSYPDALQ
eukprot:3082707-Prymnesium_polylepis.1